MKILPTGDIAAIENGENNKILADKNDLGDHSKALFALEFQNWEKHSTVITLQYALVCRLNPVMKSKVAGH